jgi:predicted dienelactone hydrolase
MSSKKGSRSSPWSSETMSGDINHERRRFLGTAAVTIAAAQLGALGSASAQAGPAPPNGPFGPVKQIDAGLLNVGYVEAGPGNGPVAILLHGWPYDIHSFEDVAPRLATSGYRVIVPYLRGYGTTRFLSSDTSGMASSRCWRWT